MEEMANEQVRARVGVFAASGTATGRGRCHLCKLRHRRATRAAGVQVNYGKASAIRKTSLACRVCRLRLCVLGLTPCLVNITPQTLQILCGHRRERVQHPTYGLR